MIDLPALRAELVADEGVRLKPYRCPAGKLTIGIGRNLEDVGISRATADQMLDEDISACLMDCASFPWFDGLDPVRQRAIVNFRFNVGAGTLRQFKKLLGALERRDFASAGDELLHSAWAGQIQPARRDRIIRQVRTGA